MKKKNFFVPCLASFFDRPCASMSTIRHRNTNLLRALMRARSSNPWWHRRQVISSKQYVFSKDFLITLQMGRLRPKLHKQDDYAAIVRVAEQAASGYFAREYEGQQ